MTNKFIKLVLFILLIFILATTSVLAADNNLIRAIIGEPGNGGGGNGDKFKFYCQYDGWNYGSCDIIGSGCTPTSLAMIMSTFLGNTYTPEYVSKNTPIDPTIQKHIGCGCSIVSGRRICGTSYPNGITSALNWAENRGMDTRRSIVPYGVSGGAIDLTAVKDFTSRGFYVLAGADIEYCCSGGSGGHSFVIYDANPAKGTILYYDPTYCANYNDNRAKPQEIKTNKINEWKYAYPVRKKR